MPRAPRVLLILLATSACVRSHATECGDVSCPEDSQCVTYAPTGGTFCVADDQTECVGAADGTLCDGETGTCFGGGCFPVGCGNGHIDDVVYQHPEECDDGNRRSHDGCSSSCTNEVATWTMEAPGPTTLRWGHAMTYDAGRDTVVSFGGEEGGFSRETWLRIGARWQSVAPPGLVPTPRTDTAIAYDAARERVVMFGGYQGALPNRETWLWDGTRWQTVTPTTVPPARRAHAMAYDSIRKVVVLYGGLDSNDAPLADTWTWNGRDWTQIGGVGPPPFSGHAMAFDPARGEIIMVGGKTSVTTWRFDGAQWSQAASSGPPVGTNIALAYDPVRRNVLWIGTTSGPLVQFAWDGMAWQQRAVTSLPPAVISAAATTDARGPVVLGGILPTSAGTDAVSTWDGNTWTVQPRPVPPATRNGMAIALDSVRARIGVFSDYYSARQDSWELGPRGWESTGSQFPMYQIGFNAIAAYDEVARATVVLAGTKTSVWNGKVWTNDAAVAPNIIGPEMVYAPGFGTVLVGSPPSSAGVAPRMRTFVRNGGSWVESSGTGPPPRTGFALGYDPVARRVLMFGGLAEETSLVPTELADTWSLDVASGTWTELAPISQPPKRDMASLAWDDARQRLVLVGGSSADTWEWDRDAQTWQPVLVGGLPPEGALPQQRLSPAISAPDGDGIMVVGTVFRENGPLFGVYRLRWIGTGPLEACTGSRDLDRDGLAGCADPDCALACKRVAVTCGNATCDDTESCSTCAQDCGACPERCGDFTCTSGETAETCPGDCGMPSAP